MINLALKLLTKPRRVRWRDNLGKGGSAFMATKKKAGGKKKAAKKAAKKKK